MFNRRTGHKRYKIISEDGFGITLKVPRYQKTNIRVGSKEEAEAKGLGPRGSKNFYTISDGSVVLDGYLAEPASENTVEMTVRKDTNITQASWAELQKEIEHLLDYHD
jgi:hypothetical protein